MIRRVRLRRFKRFEDVTLDLAGPVVLAGQNNSGKTTALQALAAWSLAFEQWKLLNDFSKHGGGYSRKPVARQAFSAVPLRSFDLLWNQRNYAGSPIEIEVEGEGWTLPMELIADSTEQIYVRPRRDARREVLGRELPRVAYVSSVDGLDIEEPAINNPEWIKTLLGRQRPGAILRNLLLEVSQGNRWETLTASVRKLFGVELQLPQTPGGQIVCEFRRPGSPFSLDLMSAGSGFQQVLLLLACLHTRPGSVLLIDEPDAHLHVFLQDTIYSELRRVAVETRSQIILATHSEVIFRSAPPEELLVMLGPPRRLSTVAERERLADAMKMLEQVDIVQALEAPGVLYVEGHTDLHLLRSWADRLSHPAKEFLNREPFWKPLVWETRPNGEGIRASDHFAALQLIREDITGVCLVDSDGSPPRQAGAVARPRALNRITWSRYEAESYLLHPQALRRFLQQVTGNDPEAPMRKFFTDRFGEELTTRFYASPFTPPDLVENYFQTRKARTEIVGALLEECGLHGFPYTSFDEIAALMTAEEIHPEVRQKLDFIQHAFGL